MAKKNAAKIAPLDKEDRILQALLRAPPYQSLATLAIIIGWTNSKNEPDRKTVENAINRLRRTKPALVRKSRHGWRLTIDGETIARMLSEAEPAADQRRREIVEHDNLKTWTRRRLRRRLQTYLWRQSLPIIAPQRRPEVPYE